MFKELWTLIKMLFQSKPSEAVGKDLEVIVMKHFPFAGNRYMSWCGKVITRSEKKAVIDRFLTTLAGNKSKNHEGWHVKQGIDEHGDNWLRYYLNYFWHWIKWNPLIKPAHACYYINRYECQAYAMEDYPVDWECDSRKDLKGKYSIKKAKKKYVELGSTSKAWKAYVKSL